MLKFKTQNSVLISGHTYKKFIVRAFNKYDKNELKTYFRNAYKDCDRLIDDIPNDSSLLFDLDYLKVMNDSKALTAEKKQEMRLKMLRHLRNYNAGLGYSPVEISTKNTDYEMQEFIYFVMKYCKCI